MDKCEFCHGEIESDVKKCRHCGEWLKKWKYTPTKQISTLVIGLAFYYLLTQIIANHFIKDRLDFFPKKVFYSESSNELALEFTEQRTKDHLYVVGTITNKSSHRYESVDIGTTYFDDKNQILDYEQEYIGTLEPGKTHKFKSDFTCCSSKKDQSRDYTKYKRFEVQIEDAYYEVPRKEKF